MKKRALTGIATLSVVSAEAEPHIRRIVLILRDEILAWEAEIPNGA